MRRWWAGTGWTDEKELAFQEGWALRILTCPRKRCRRMRTCFWPRQEGCPGLTTYPFSEAETAERVRLVRAVLKNRLYEVDAGIVPTGEERAAEAERVREMRERALKRVSAWLKAGERPEAIFQRVAGRERESGLPAGNDKDQIVQCSVAKYPPTFLMKSHTSPVDLPLV